MGSLRFYRFAGTLFDAGSHPPLRIVQASAEALKAHSAYLKKLEASADGCAWGVVTVSAETS